MVAQLFVAATNAAIRTVPIPQDTTPEQRARLQPSIPAEVKEIPFAEETAQPTLTPEEKQRGLLLFQRPITDPVYPNTHPKSHERLRELTAFGTPGEFEPLTFSIYPTRDLKNLKVRVSNLRYAGATIPGSNIDVGLVTYWAVAYPRYTSMQAFRRTPELVEKVTVHSSPAGECQRWWITVRVPDDAPAGLYRGTVTVWDNTMERALSIPTALRVLPFQLKSDPGKHYSTYYYLRNRTQFKNRDEAFIQKAIGNEYRAMVDLGIDSCPTLYIRVEGDPERIVISHVEELERMLAVGIRGPIPLAGGNAISHIYQKTTPGGKRGSHWKISTMPPPEFYERVTEMFRGLAAEAKRRDWPELICCPLDEVDASRKEFGTRVYQAVRDAGIRTYITKNPLAADAADYRDAVDIWCSQPYSATYENIVAQDRYEYWCYPNHNAGEKKDRRIMCKGGRMTYGFGFWRSGYTTLIPWNWAWTPGDDQFDYLRGRRSGCGQRIGDDGEVIPALYWQCFREGRDDARYIYTLQQTIWEREGSTDSECQRLLKEGKQLLLNTWRAINVQQKYLADDMWPSEEFNARRWKLALTTEALGRFPATRQGTAPSVMVEQADLPAARGRVSFLDAALEQGQLEAFSLGGDFTKWVNVTGEGKANVMPEAGENGRPGLRWTVKVDHKTDGGGEKGDYPIGWPRIYRGFAKNELDMTAFDYLRFNMRIDSDRDEVADDSTPVGFTLHSNKFYEVTRDLGGRQRVWLPVIFPIRSLIDTVGQGEAPWKSIEKVQFFIGESNYTHGTELTLDVSDVSLLRFKAPMIRDVSAPAFVLLPAASLPITVNVMGTRGTTPGVNTIEATLMTPEGELRAKYSQDLAEGSALLLNASQIKPGSYNLVASIKNADGQVCSQHTKQVECLKGPMWE